MPNHVIIIGAGIAGLSAAYELTRRGVPVTVLEASDRAGGVILSEQVDGYTIDAGPDSLLVQKPEAIRLCEELGLGDRLVPTKPPRLAYILRGGRLHPLPPASMLGIPTRPAALLKNRLFSIPGKIRMGAELFVPPRRDGEDESIGAFVTRRFGVEATTYLAEPLLAGIHAGDVNRLSIRSLFPRFVEAEQRHGSLLRAFRAHRPEASSEGAFRSLPGGLSELVNALVAALPPDVIRLRAPLKRVSLGPGEAPFRLEVAGGATIVAESVILATPTYVSGAVLGDIDTALARLCGEVPYASTATVAMAFPRQAVADPLNGTGFVAPLAEGTGILAASWLSSKWPHRAPPDHVLMRTFVGGARDPRGFEQSDQELLRVSLAVLRPLLRITGEPTLTRVYRWARASAQHEVGHQARVAAIERAAARHPGLFLTGSGLRGVGIPDCVADGRATAKAAAEWLQQRATLQQSSRIPNSKF